MGVAARQVDLIEELWRGAPPSGNATADWPFWLVICTEAIEDRPGRVMLTKGYKYVHETEQSAESEALRLATKFKGFEFAVVKSVAVVRYHDKKRRAVWEECE